MQPVGLEPGMPADVLGCGSDSGYETADREGGSEFDDCDSASE